MKNQDLSNNKSLKKGGSCSTIVISVSLGIATFASIIISFFDPLFTLNENQLLYLFSAMAQVVGTVFALTLTAYVFFVGKFKESTNSEEMYFDAAASILNKLFHCLIMISITCGLTILLCIVGIILLHNCNSVYNFIINESVFLFSICIVSTLFFGVMLLDPAKIDKEIVLLKKKADEFFKELNKDAPGDFSDFLKSYNMLEKTVLEFAEECMRDQNELNYNNKYQIIQSLKVLQQNEIINNRLFVEINELRMYRNALVHGMNFNVSQNICNRLSEIQEALHRALNVYKTSGKDSEEWQLAIKAIYDLSNKD